MLQSELFAKPQTLNTSYAFSSHTHNIRRDRAKGLRQTTLGGFNKEILTQTRCLLLLGRSDRNNFVTKERQEDVVTDLNSVDVEQTLVGRDEGKVDGVSGHPTVLTKEEGNEI